MLDLRNRTPFAAAIVPGLDKLGRDTLTVVVKGTFDLGRGDTLPVAERQVAIQHADAFHGEPGTSSLLYEADGCPAKVGTDVILVGHAYAREASATSVDVILAVGPVKKTVRVLGDRVWTRALGTFVPSKPLAVAGVPLVYERAFGGRDVADPDGKRYDARNPLGPGFSGDEDADVLEGLRLPNLESPSALIDGPLDRPEPAAFGFVGRDARPRRDYAGTFDDRWRAERCPFLPDDFDDRYHSGAPSDQIAIPHLRGGEHALVSGASERGDVRFRVPARPLEIAMRARGTITNHRPVLDTLLVAPDERRAIVTWRLTVPTARALLYIDWIRVSEKRA